MSKSNRRQFLQLAAAVPALFARAPHLDAAEYDLVIHNGRVIDPAGNIDRISDVAIRAGKIAAVHPNIPASSATATIDAAGKIVTPGLIDIHTHISDPKMTPASCLLDGVTSICDAGSTGWGNVGKMVGIAQNSPNRVRIFVNISRLGNNSENENIDITHDDPAACARAIDQYRPWIAGIKVRLSRPMSGDNDLEATRRAQQAAAPHKLPLMLHIGDTAHSLADILALLKPGDIATHMFTPDRGILDDSGRILPEAIEARKRGVLFDVGNGRNGHFRWDIAERVLKQNFLPDTISSDLNLPGRSDNVFSFPNVLSKFLMLGMPVDQVIGRATANPARVISSFHPYGTLRPGSAADVAVFELREGHFDFVDNYKQVRTGTQKLFPYAVINGGKRVV